MGGGGVGEGEEGGIVLMLYPKIIMIFLYTKKHDSLYSDSILYLYISSYIYIQINYTHTHPTSSGFFLLLFLFLLVLKSWSCLASLEEASRTSQCVKLCIVMLLVLNLFNNY